MQTAVITGFIGEIGLNLLGERSLELRAETPIGFHPSSLLQRFKRTGCMRVACELHGQMDRKRALGEWMQRSNSQKIELSVGPAIFFPYPGKHFFLFWRQRPTVTFEHILQEGYFPVSDKMPTFILNGDYPFSVSLWNLRPMWHSLRLLLLSCLCLEGL